MADIEDIYLAESRLEELRAGRSRSFIEFEASAKKELSKLDKQAAQRVVGFLRERVAPLHDPAPSARP